MRDGHVELHDNTVVARADFRVVHVVPEVDVHDHVEPAIVQPTDLAVAPRGVHDLVKISLKFAICLQIGLHGVPGNLLGGRRPVGAHVESRGVSCVDVGFVWSGEELRWWCEDVAEVIAMVSEGVQIGGVKVLKMELAMVSEGVQSGGGSDLDLKREGEGRSSYCRSVPIVRAIS